MPQEKHMQEWFVGWGTPREGQYDGMHTNDRLETLFPHTMHGLHVFMLFAIITSCKSLLSRAHHLRGRLLIQFGGAY
jgi:hypothetical protein